VTPIKAICAALCGLLLIPILVIGAVAGGLEPATPTTAQGSPIALPADLTELGRAVLSSSTIELTPNARHDVEAGTVDPRVLEVLLVLAQTHRLGPVGPLITGHNWFVKGTGRVSNHMFGRAADIMGVDGAPVSIANPTAREVMAEILLLSPPLLPDELGGPWLLSSVSTRVFTKDHGDHIHFGWGS